MEAAERAARAARRLARPRTWKALLLAVSEPDNDEIWEFIDRDRTPLYLEDPRPWMPADAIEEIAAEIHPNIRVIEWGAGASTLWLVSRAADVVSLETDKGWADTIRARARGFADVRHVDSSDDASFLPAVDGFDVAIIDSADRRTDCAEHLMNHGFSGLVVWDDTHRREYRASMWKMADRAERQRHFAGLHGTLTPKMTSLFWLTA